MIKYVYGIPIYNQYKLQKSMIISYYDFLFFIYKNMKRIVQKKVRISVSLNKDLVDMLNEKTSNRSNYLDWVLLEYFNKLGEDISKIKL